jgi:5-methylcytosine-specific restriction endonuclease McrA
MTGSSGVDDEMWKVLLKRDDYMCLHCNSQENLSPHHYKSRGSKEGTNDLDNLMLLCWRCHRDYHDGRLKIEKINNHFYFKLIKQIPSGT